MLLAIRTFLLAEFGFYFFHRWWSHTFPFSLHRRHHEGRGAMADEVSGTIAMCLAHLFGPLRVNVTVYYTYTVALIAVHKLTHLENVPRLLRFHSAYHRLHHDDPTTNYAIVTPLMDLLFKTARFPPRRSSFRR